MHVFLRNASLLLATTLAFGACSDDDNDADNGAGTQAAGFISQNLLSDQQGVAINTSANVVNAWGLAMDGQSFWLANNGTGVVSVIAPDGSPSKFAPATSSVNAGPGITGIVRNSTGAFMIGSSNNRAAAQMLVASETGQIFGINPNVSGTPQVVIDNSAAGAIYKGLAIWNASDGSVRLGAADFHNGRIDVWDGNFQPIASVTFVDPTLTEGLAPFNIVAINRNLYVTFAVQDADKEDDVPGVGNGRIDVFDIDGNFSTVLLDRDGLNSPWGMALASNNFATDLGNQLIVGNFGDGTLLAVDPSSGASSQLKTPSGNPVVIPGVWGLQFGSGGSLGSSSALYFASGPSGEQHGLYGRIFLSTLNVP